ncbi:MULTISPECIES: group II intron maturase-specific domain-containing protein [unclassified Pseudofrankia]|uniref:group II intron maturase-specific domain-containing protein n=1 Tax=unclassified Pseudofrankia TaxID=2994372 RepID=UPI002378B2FC|nr:MULTISPECIES: group II intron maturase-specific domain-containing protein [unclassified Pseudofrankia]MDT3445130.1 group II intron maturase-specific domain-containing protein [Pseudofrankia sp. BMG5.37]
MSALPDDAGPASEAGRWTRGTSAVKPLKSDHQPKPGGYGGWLEYFTMFYPSVVIPIGVRIDRHLMRWAKRKYKRLKRSDRRAWAWLGGVRERSPGLFAHWALRY